MIVCLCEGITDRDVRSMARNGLASAEAVGRACGAGTCCGACRPTIETLLDDEQARANQSRVAEGPLAGLALAAAHAAG